MASGMTPLAIMIANARWAHAQATQLTEELAQAEPSQSAELFREMMHFRQLAVEWRIWPRPMFTRGLRPWRTGTQTRRQSGWPKGQCHHTWRCA